jgi:hypothetical protein
MKHRIPGPFQHRHLMQMELHRRQAQGPRQGPRPPPPTALVPAGPRLAAAAERSSPAAWKGMRCLHVEERLLGSAPWLGSETLVTPLACRTSVATLNATTSKTKAPARNAKCLPMLPPGAGTEVVCVKRERSTASKYCNGVVTQKKEGLGPSESQCCSGQAGGESACSAAAVRHPCVLSGCQSSNVEARHDCNADESQSQHSRGTMLLRPLLQAARCAAPTPQRPAGGVGP